LAGWEAFYNEATWSTERYFSRKVVDQVFASNPMTLRLKQNATTLDGGESLELSSVFAFQAAEWFTEWDTYANVHKEEMSAGRLDWKYLTRAVVLSQAQLLKNSSSEERRYDLAMQKNVVAAKAMADAVGTALFATTQVTNGIDSLDNYCAAGTTTYAGITRATTGDAATWASNVDTTAVLSLSALQTGKGAATEGNESPNFHVTTQVNFNRYFDLLTPIQRIGSETMATAGFESLLFVNAPVVVDSHVADNYWYMFNMNHLDLAAHRMAFFTFQRSPMPVNQWVHIGRYFLMGNARGHAPRLNTKFTSFTS
jgi:hypothetical protein